MLLYFIEVSIRLLTFISLEGLLFCLLFETILFPELLVLILPLYIEVMAIIKGLCPYLENKMLALFTECSFKKI